MVPQDSHTLSHTLSPSPSLPLPPSPHPPPLQPSLSTSLPPPSLPLSLDLSILLPLCPTTAPHSLSLSFPCLPANSCQPALGCGGDQYHHKVVELPCPCNILSKPLNSHFKANRPMCMCRLTSNSFPIGTGGLYHLSAFTLI